MLTLPNIVTTVTMQAQNVAPPDVWKDKFLIQSTTVPMGTKEELFTSTTVGVTNIGLMVNSRGGKMGG